MSAAAATTQSAEVLDYLRRKYKQFRPDTEQARSDFAMFDPWINPDEGYIPYCSKCMAEFETFKRAADKSECEMEHTSACLWNDYFVAKIRLINPAVVFRRKKTRGPVGGGKK